MSRVLLVEDEAELGASVAEYLTLSGIEVTHVGDAESAWQEISSGSVALVLLDITLPGMSGLELCRRIREHSELPVLFLSARRSDDDQVLALSTGGDDYITKPFSLAVLLAKVRRMLSRLDAATGGGYDDGHLRIDLGTGRVFVAGEEVELRGMEFRLLAHLVRNRERIVGKRELFDEVWADAYTGDGTLTVHIRRLRQKIEPDPAAPTYLRTAWGRGYSFHGRDR